MLKQYAILQCKHQFLPLATQLRGISRQFLENVALAQTKWCESPQGRFVWAPRKRPQKRDFLKKNQAQIARGEGATGLDCNLIPRELTL